MESLDLAILEMKGERYDAAATSLRRGVSDGDLRCSFVLGLLTLEGKGTVRAAATRAKISKASSSGWTRTRSAGTGR
jgi:hypothetical protein